MNETEEEHDHEQPIFFDIAMNKLKKRFPIDDINFFDPKSDFNIDVSTIMLSEQIAKGSYGVVYNGVMRREKYAIKVEDLRTGVEEQVNILSELTILQSYPHEYLVKFYGTGYLSKSLSEAKVMIIMELCENGALREKIQEDLPWNLVVRLASDISSGLSFLHENQIVHRDIKTTNILVDKDWRAKICDFSFACHVNSLLKQEFVYGTDEFMSPEIAMGEDFGTASGLSFAPPSMSLSSIDIFSFGIVLCEMITKQEPSAYFLKRTAQNNCFALPEEELRSAVLADCPESLEALTIECCNLEPELRPKASDSVDWLQSLLEELGEDLTSTIETLSSEKSALVGVSPIREGTVIYPKTKDLKVARFASPYPSTSHPTKSPGMNVNEATTRIAYLEVQVQELRAENSCLTREVASLNKKVDDLLKVLEPPPMTRLNSSGRFSTNGSATNTPRYQDPDMSASQHSFSNTEFPTPDKDRHLKKLSSEIEYLKFRFSKMSNDIALLKSKELSKIDHSESNSEEPPQLLSPSRGSLKSEFRDIILADKEDKGNFGSQKWAISKQGDSPLVRMGSDHSKPSKRQSPTSYGVSPPNSQVHGIFATKPSLEIIEVEENSSDDDDYSTRSREENDPNIDAVVRSFLDVVGKCSEITHQSQSTLRSLEDRPTSQDPSSSYEGEGIHKGTRVSSKSEFHYSPHPGFLSQLRLPLTRDLRYRDEQNRNGQRSQSPISTTTSLTSKPSILSQPFMKGQSSTSHGVSSVSPNLTSKRSLYESAPPSSFSGSPEDEDEQDQMDTHTPPNVLTTWRNVQSRTPPRYPSSTKKYPEEVKESGKMVLEDIMSADHISPDHHSPGIYPSSNRYKNVRIPEKSSSRPFRSGSKASSSPSLLEKLEADKQRADSAKNFFQTDLVYNSIFCKDEKHVVNMRSTPSSSVATDRGKSHPKPLGHLLGSK